MIKLVVCDVDGTLLDRRKRLDTQILPVLETLRRQNIQFTLATGRNEVIVRDYVDILNIDIPYATDNGANLYCRHQLLSSAVLDKDDLQRVVSRLMAEKIPFTFFDQRQGYCFSESKKLNEIRRLFLNRLKLSSVDETTDTSALKVYKLTLDAAGYPDMEVLAEQIRSVCPRIAFRRSEDSLYTITAQGTSKGQALKRIAEYLNIELQDVLSIGDNFNDIAMFENSGYSVAMGNSDEQVKQRADEVAQSNDENGVSDVLIRHFIHSKEGSWKS